MIKACGKVGNIVEAEKYFLDAKKSKIFTSFSSK